MLNKFNLQNVKKMKKENKIKYQNILISEGRKKKKQKAESEMRTKK